MGRTARWGVVALVVVAALGAWFLTKRKAPPGPKYVTATIDRGNIVGRVTATGTVSALVTVQVGAQVSGRILELGADFNSKVSKGQVLAKLDPELFVAAAAQTRANEKAAEANLVRAKAQVLDSERKLKRARQLLEGNLVAQADFDAAQADFDMNTASVAAAEASVMQTRATRQQAEVNLTYTVIRSPIDGTVISRSVDVGQTVAASLQAPTLFTIAENLGHMQVDTSVAEADVGKLKEGMQASFLVDAFSGRPFTGTIRQIRFAPQVVQNVVTYDAVIDVENPELLLRPGMTANVTFTYARADDVIRVPNAALRFRLDPSERMGGRPDGGGGRWARDGGARGPGVGGPPGERDPNLKMVWVLKDAEPTRVMVKTGLSDGSFTQALESALAEGDEVIVDRQSDGQAKPSGSPQGGPPGGMRRMF